MKVFDKAHSLEMRSDPMNDLFPEVVNRAELPEPQRKYFIVGFWQNWWTVKPKLYESDTCELIQQEMHRMIASGWAGVTVMKLPEELWKQK